MTNSDASSLRSEIDRLPPFEQFPVVPVLTTVLLTFVTLGLYWAWWFHSRNRVLDQLLPDWPIPMAFRQLCISGAAINLLFAIVVATAYAGDAAMEMMVRTLSLAINILYLVWTISFRQRLCFLLGQEAPRSLVPGPFLTVLLGVWYLQYKINQVVAARNPSLM